MTTTVHRLRLCGDRSFGGKVPARPLGVLLTELPLLIQDTVSMALHFHSAWRGRPPTWVRRASDIRLVDVEGNTNTELVFEAPPIAEAAPELYHRSDNWPPLPAPEVTGFDLFADLLGDIEAQNQASDRYDAPLLTRLKRLRTFFNQGFEAVEPLLGLPATPGSTLGTTRSRPRLAPAVLDAAKELLAATPGPQRTRIVGKLMRVDATTGSMALLLDSGDEVRGSLVEKGGDELATLLDTRILVFGQVIYRPSRRVLRLDVDRVRAALDTDAFFNFLPEPVDGPLVTEEHHRRNVEALRNTFGKWPGDESDEEIQRALKEMK
jgi:hypothetical protein